MCHGMKLHFHNWTDCNRVTYLVELLEWVCTLLGFLGLENFGKQGFKNKDSRPKVTKMGSIDGHRIDYNGVGVLRHTPSKD